MNKILKSMLSAGVLLMSAHSHAFVKGADVSWMTEMEAKNYDFYNDWGQKQDLLSILKDHGMNAVRLRVWVNPSDKYSTLDDVIAKAKRAKQAGMSIMIDFHYSDTWADPAHQAKPGAWSSDDFEGLMKRVWWYTHDSLQSLKDAGITPKWVQVGNETNNGMLWNDGMASNNMKQYAWLYNSGRNAVKDVFPDAKVIVHLANCHDNPNFRWIFDGLKEYGAQWDIIGASTYPKNAGSLTWKQATQQCLNNLNDMVSRYNKDVMITEVGVPWDDSEAKTIVSDVISKVRSVDGGRGLGVFYWEPEAYNWKGYTLGAWDPKTKKPTAALDAFLE